LNETCKNAIDIKEFASNIQIDAEEFEDCGDIGYVKGLSNIIHNNLKRLKDTERPIYNSDSKRNIMYVKSGGEWFKEQEGECPKLMQALHVVEHTNYINIFEWKKQHPQYNRAYTKDNDRYDLMCRGINSFSTTKYGGDSAQKRRSIIRNIAGFTHIDKHKFRN
jgi:hypothetical protein